MLSKTASQDVLNPESRAFYRRALDLLKQSGAPFLVGGAYALARYTGIVRHTKDFDVFMRPEDAPKVLNLFAQHGYQTEMTFPHWLGKVFSGEDFLDIIFSSGNGVARVDDAWFEHAIDDEVVGEQVQLCPAEEMIWSKGFVLERERFDGADVAHLIRACGEHMDWRRLLQRYGSHWRVLFAHLVLFGFVYPSDRAKVPDWVMDELTQRLQQETHNPGPEHKVCQGTLISREQYLIDIREWGYKDARLVEHDMTPADIQHWTNAIGHSE